MSELKYQVGEAVTFSKAPDDLSVRAVGVITEAGVESEGAPEPHYRVQLQTVLGDERPVEVFSESELSLVLSKPLGWHEGLLTRLHLVLANADGDDRSTEYILFQVREVIAEFSTAKKGEGEWQELALLLTAYHLGGPAGVDRAAKLP
ncbi:MULTISPECIES: hypothetical protein [Mycobacteriaceae]|uniref:Uncharacterized protein n=1 Tax=Mycolicibacterium fluoranthenivorans TaxID=258505 RepID=A0A1G4W1Q8_9MYCO|nr:MULTISPECIES: hypothetical protein [Mycobacteriaceae]MCV7251168.1 hypothetical protein [Mycobacterium hackensackense]SCX15312.1 hypothetical protein SAMN02799620_02034 [Mycolicibacterium fluoranthenivorans]